MIVVSLMLGAFLGYFATKQKKEKIKPWVIIALFIAISIGLVLDPLLSYFVIAITGLVVLAVLMIALLKQVNSIQRDEKENIRDTCYKYDKRLEDKS